MVFTTHQCGLVMRWVASVVSHNASRSSCVCWCLHGLALQYLADLCPKIALRTAVTIALLLTTKQQQRIYTKKTNPNNNKLAPVKNPKKTLKSQNLKQFVCKNCSYQCVYVSMWLCGIVLHITAQNSSDNLPPYPPGARIDLAIYVACWSTADFNW